MDATDSQGAGTLETPADAGKDDAGKDDAGVVKRWLMEWELSSKMEEGWRGMAEDAVDRFRDRAQEKKGEQKGRTLGTKFNILRANVETLQPALYNSTPKPDVRRRFRDADPLGKAVSELLERALSFQMDTGDFDGVMRLDVKDMLLPGRGVSRVRYKPTLATGEREASGAPDTTEGTTDQPEKYEYKAWEAVCLEHVQWRDFRRGPGRTWAEVSWVGFRSYPTREEAVELFGKVAETIDLDAVPDGGDSKEKTDDDGPDADTFKRLTVYEIWDKESAKVYFIAPSLKDKPLKVEDDPLGLQGFFPIPRPLYACEQTDSLVPVEDYRAYRDQAEELDRITARITNLIKACKVRGIYDSTIAEMSQVLTGVDNELIPSENAAALIDRGGLDKAIWLLPVETIAKVLVQLYEQREQIKNTIYEITGISDILRGSSVASETATAQQIKANWGTQRIQERQREVQRYARDLIRMMAEIIAEHFDPQTLGLMTGMQIPPEQWPMILQVLRSDAMRAYKVDIETDSTVAGDLQQAQENASKFVEGMASLMQALGPAVQEGAMPMEVATKMLVGLSQMFKLPRSVSDALESIGDQPAQPQAPQPDPNAPAIAKAQGESEARMQEVRQAPDIERMKAQANSETQIAEAKIKADADMKKALLDSLTKIEVARISAGIDAGTQMYAAELQAVLGLHATETDADVERERIAAQPEPAAA